jgi:Eukaryotic cytochrome b561
MLSAVKDSASTASSSCNVEFKGKEKTFQACFTDSTTGVSAHWNLDMSAGSIETLFLGKPESGGYVGWGWGSLEMVGSNAAIAFVDPKTNKPKIADYFLQAATAEGVQENTKQHFNSSDADVTADGTVMGLFIRPMATDVSNGPTKAIWAMGHKVSSSKSLSQHSRASRASSTIDLSLRASTSGASEVGYSSKLNVHAWLMGVSWLILVPIGILTMRFFKTYNPATFQIHRAIMTLSFVAIVIAYALGLAEGSRSETAHLVVGSVAFALASLQIVGGVFRPQKGKPLRNVFYILHSWMGRMAFVLAAVNIFIGLRILKPATVYYVLAGLALFITAVVFGFFSFLPTRFPTKEEEKPVPVDSSGEEDVPPAEPDL